MKKLNADTETLQVIAEWNSMSKTKQNNVCVKLLKGIPKHDHFALHDAILRNQEDKYRGKLPLTMVNIIDRYCHFTKIDKDTLMSHYRGTEMKDARHTLCHFIFKEVKDKNLLKLSLKSIGDSFGGRDHATMLHSNRKAIEYIESEKAFRENYHLVSNYLCAYFAIGKYAN